MLNARCIYKSVVQMLLAALLLGSLHVSAQDMQPVQATGVISDSLGVPVPYATVALVGENGRAVAMAACDVEGRFAFPMPAEGDYSLEISCLGYSPCRYKVSIVPASPDLGSFAIVPGVRIDDVVVTTKVDPVRVEVDRLIYDVGKDPDAANSSTLQILGRVPFVEIDPKTDKIKVMGEESNFSVIVNGRKSLVLSESNQYVAKLLQGDKLKQIELITSPDGKYSDRTAVINIVTHSDLPDMFAVNLGAEYYSNFASGGVNVYSGNLDVTQKVGRLVYNLHYYTSNGSDRYGDRLVSLDENYLSEEYRFNESASAGTLVSGINSFGLKASYDISSRDLLTIGVGANLNVDETTGGVQNRFSDIDGNITRSFDSRSHAAADKTAIYGEIGYEHGFKAKPGRLLTMIYSLNRGNDSYDYDNLVEPIVDYMSAHNIRRD